MTRRTLVFLAASAMATLLAGCGGTDQGQGSQQASSSSQKTTLPSSQQTTEPTTNETLVGRCADSRSTSAQQGEASLGEASNGEIAFSRIAQGAAQYSKGIYMIDEEGAHETRLPQITQFDANPVWSPDGQRIAIGALSASIEGNLYVMNADGTNRTEVAKNVSAGSIPTWAPDGGKIAFTRNDTYGRRSALYVINADGTSEDRLNTSILETSEHRKDLGNPVWSPAGNKIAFASLTHTDTSASSSALAETLSGIFLINMNGTGLCKLTSTAVGSNLQFGYPVWSPDGEKIAFSDVGTLNVINADGSGRKRLTSFTKAQGQYAWAPDGKRIAFVNGSDLNVINADGSGLRRLTHSASQVSWPTWSPDGQKIAFSCPFEAQVNAHTDLCVITADGTGLKRIASNIAPEGIQVAASWGRE